MFKTTKNKTTKRKRGSDERKTWIDKLDRVFSIYIRLRDSKEFGFRAARCISCGEVKPFDMFDCGHFVSRNAMAIRWDEDNCHAECSHCLTPDALILMEDLTWKPLGDVKVMDKVFSFEEERTTAQARYWRLGTVTHVHREIQDVYEVTLENGDKVRTTAEHKWLARKRGGVAYGWVETQNLWFGGVNVRGQHKTGPHTDKTHSVVCKPIKVVHQDMSNDAGWIAGMIDADGCISQQNIHNPDGSIRYGFRIAVAQCEKYPYIAQKVRKLLEKFTDNRKMCRQFMQKWQEGDGRLSHNYNMYQYMITGTNIEKVMFLQKVRPLKMKKVDINKLGMIRSRYDSKVMSVKYVGKQEIVVMETDTHTFIANGYAMHNCNRMQGDHLLGYRKNLILKLGRKIVDRSIVAQSLPNDKKLLLIKKMGEQRVEELESLKKANKKWDVGDLKAMYIHYAEKVLELKKQM